MKKSNNQNSRKYEKNKDNLEHEDSLAILKEKFRSNSTGTDDDLAIDIQDALGRDILLSSVADNIHVTVEGEIATLEGEVYKSKEKITAGAIASAFAGDDNVNNYLNVV